MAETQAYLTAAEARELVQAKHDKDNAEALAYALAVIQQRALAGKRSALFQVPEFDTDAEPVDKHVATMLNKLGYAANVSNGQLEVVW